jgi:CRP-like cAMP-binding protein
MSAEAFAREVSQLDGPVESRLRRHAQLMVTQLARNAACNRAHTVRQRAARWLLTAVDRTDGSRFELTQDALAQLLAVRRASVNEVAQALSQDGSITYNRGAVEVLDRDSLHTNACDCYDVIARANAAALQPGAASTTLQVPTVLATS